MSTNGRDLQGKFKKGCRGGPGRPRRAVEAEYLAALSDACPVDKWKSIVEKAVAQALDGDARSREWLASHLMGLPMTLLDLAAQEKVPKAIETDLKIRAEVLEYDLEQRQYDCDVADPIGEGLDDLDLL